VNFSAFLISKKIDESAFLKAEPELFEAWKAEFEQMHPNSFTVQKLNLINPIRRKYQLKESPPANGGATQSLTVSPVIPKPGRPMIPKPKIS
jgi:hypothetical protein